MSPQFRTTLDSPHDIYTPTKFKIQFIKLIYGLPLFSSGLQMVSQSPV